MRGRLEPTPGDVEDDLALAARDGPGREGTAVALELGELSELRSTANQ